MNDGSKGYPASESKIKDYYYIILDYYSKSRIKR